MTYWTVFRKCYPSYDEDMCWEKEWDYFDNREEAIKRANDMESNFSDKEWEGHPYYKCKFYAEEISEEYIAEKQRRWANEQVASYILD